MIASPIVIYHFIYIIKFMFVFAYAQCDNCDGDKNKTYRIQATNQNECHSASFSGDMGFNARTCASVYTQNIVEFFCFQWKKNEERKGNTIVDVFVFLVVQNKDMRLHHRRVRVRFGEKKATTKKTNGIK